MRKCEKWRCGWDKCKVPYFHFLVKKISFDWWDRLISSHRIESYVFFAFIYFFQKRYELWKIEMSHPQQKRLKSFFPTLIFSSKIISFKILLLEGYTYCKSTKLLNFLKKCEIYAPLKIVVDGTELSWMGHLLLCL